MRQLMPIHEWAKQEHLAEATVRRLIATDPDFPVVDIAESGNRPRSRIVTRDVPRWGRKQRIRRRLAGRTLRVIQAGEREVVPSRVPRPWVPVSFDEYCTAAMAYARYRETDGRWYADIPPCGDVAGGGDTRAQAAIACRAALATWIRVTALGGSAGLPALDGLRLPAEAMAHAD
jgi:predicted RNase H-like HicB family nuclease